jgi:hypothetical protein
VEWLILWYTNEKELTTMSPQNHNRRIAAVLLADAVNKIEGVPISRQSKQLSARWVKGEITGAEMKDALIATHKRPPAEATHA